MNFFKDKEEKIIVFVLEPQPDITPYEVALLLKFSRFSSKEIEEEMPDSCKRHLKKKEITYLHTFWLGRKYKEKREIEW